MTIRTVLLTLKQRTKETIITWTLKDIRGNEKIYNVLFLFRKKTEMLNNNLGFNKNIYV